MNLIETECKLDLVQLMWRLIPEWKWLEMPDSESDDGSGELL